MRRVVVNDHRHDPGGFLVAIQQGTRGRAAINDRDTGNAGLLQQVQTTFVRAKAFAVAVGDGDDRIWCLASPHRTHRFHQDRL